MTGASEVDLVVTGAGSLAAATLLALDVTPGEALAVIVAARESDRARWLVRAAAARAAATKRPFRVRFEPVEWNDTVSLRALFVRARPRAVLHTASLQSPWAMNRSDAWCGLVREAGYGVTLPLQFVLAERAGRALAKSAPEAVFLNACYPDAVNSLLVSSGVPVLCGIGNVAILAAHLEVELPRGSQGALRVLAHHAHVSAAIRGVAATVPIRAWRGAASIDAHTWFERMRLPSDDRLNAVTGVTAAALLRALLARDASYRGHVPGPGGLPGGYPISVRNGNLSLDLPDAVSRDEAIKFNEACAEMDGVVVPPGRAARYADSTLDRMDQAGARFGVRLSRDFASAPVHIQARELLQLRAALST